MASEPMDVDTTSSPTFRGVPLSEIPNLINKPPILVNMQDIRDNNHVFMIKPFKYDPSNPHREPEPMYSTHDYIDIWDDDHVRMPCSQCYITNGEVPRWIGIQAVLTQLKQKCDNKQAIVHDIRKAIEQCNEAQYELGSLEILLCQVYSVNERDQFMFNTLPKMISLALGVGTICGQPPPLLRIGTNRCVTMSQKQAASLLACAFFCLFPRQDIWHTNTNHRSFHSLNFTRLLRSGAPWKIQKLRCILHYFQRVTQDMPKGVITFERFALPNVSIPNWIESKVPLCKLHITKTKTIEDMDGLLQVDFANAFIGGGVMDTGMVQEEIRFTICPEMLVSLLISEVMQVNEYVLLIGCEQFTLYSGYADTFTANGNCIDKTPKDSWGRKLCHVVAMDAIYFSNPLDQYSIDNMQRELLKAYTCFRMPKSFEQSMFGIATGKWGCGAFNGDKQLKAIIQLIAASEANRPLVFVTWHDGEFMESFWMIYEYLIDQQVTVKHLCLYLEQYSKQFHQSSLFEFILTTPISSLTKN